MNNSVYFTTKVPLPEKDARDIATRTAQLIRQTAPRGEQNSRRLVRATWQKGAIGIVFPDNSSHLLFLDKGVKPYTMTELEGKVIPIRGKDGRLVFRTAKNVGSFQVTSRNKLGQIRTGKRRWRHPGIEPQNFVEKALRQAMQEYSARLKGKDIMNILQDAQGEAGELFNRLLSTDNPEYQNIQMKRKYVPSTR